MTAIGDVTTTLDPAVEDLAPVAQPLLTVGAPPRDLFYRYQWQGRDLPSWSTLRAQAGVKPQLHAWALEGMVSAAVQMGSTLARAAESGEEATLRWARDRLWDAAVDAQTLPARRGTLIHEVTAAGIPAEDVAAEIRGPVQAWNRYLEVSGARVLATEFPVYNLRVGYGGTVDHLIELPGTGIGVVDKKSGKSLWGEYALQLMAYVMAEFAASGPDQVDADLTALLRESRFIALVHLTDQGWEERTIRADSRAWAAFRGLMEFATWQHEFDDIASYTLSVRKGGLR